MEDQFKSFRNSFKSCSKRLPRAMPKSKVTLEEKPNFITLANGIVTLTISRPDGHVKGISYGGIDNLLDTKENFRGYTTNYRGYWDMNGTVGGKNFYQLLGATRYRVINRHPECIELSFVGTLSPHVSLSVDKRIIMRSGVPGFYNYAIFGRPHGAPEFYLGQIRMVFMPRRDQFHYMAIADDKQKVIPMPEDVEPPRCQKLLYPEAVRLTNPANRALKGEVDDKYQYSMENKDGGVHGWVSSGTRTPVGFWIIFPSNESRNGGPTKQNLTCHTGPTCLAMFHSNHYIGPDIVAHFHKEGWRKVFGPFFVYFNTKSDAKGLWLDAKKQRQQEVEAWPYDFVSSPFYLDAIKRGSASGQLFVQDKFVHESPVPAKNVDVGLSIAKDPGGWEIESKGYQFWIQTDSKGFFNIKNVIPRSYFLHGWVPGYIGDFLHDQPVKITAGSVSKLGKLIYHPPRSGPTVWEIGFPDRTANGFFVPNPDSKLINKMYIHSPEKWRQYGLWDQYTTLHPKSDIVFTIGVSDPKKDWFFAQVNRKKGAEYIATTWQVKFHLKSVIKGKYKFQMSLASANHADIQISVNDPKKQVFEIRNLGDDNAICRHGIHGLYHLYSIDVPSSSLKMGENTMFLTSAKGGGPLTGILYDYLRLEAP